jgi:hypothetical protein
MAADLNLTLNGTPVPVYLGENATLALAQASRAEAAADAAAASEAVALAAAGPNYADTAAGLAATSEGDTFAVEDDGIVTVYRHDSGPTATELRVLPTTAALASTDPGKGAEMVALNANQTVKARLLQTTFLTDEIASGVDAGPALNAILAKIGGSKGDLGFGQIHIPSGNWDVSETILSDHQGVQFVGDGRPVLTWTGEAAADAVFDIRDSSAAKLKNFALLGGGQVPDKAIYYNDTGSADAPQDSGTNEWLTLEDLTIGRRWTQNAETYTGVDNGFQYGLYVGGPNLVNNDQIFVERCAFHDCKTAGIHVASNQSIWGQYSNVTLNACGRGLDVRSNGTYVNICFNRNTIADLRIRDNTIHDIHGFNSENAKLLIEQSLNASININGGKVVLSSTTMTGDYWATFTQVKRVNFENWWVDPGTTTGKKIQFNASSTQHGQIRIRGCSLPDGDSRDGYELNATTGACGLLFDIEQGEFRAKGRLDGSQTYDPASMADGDSLLVSQVQAIAAGIIEGDPYLVSFSTDLDSVMLTGNCYDNNLLYVRFNNETGTTKDLAAGKIRWRKLQAHEIKGRGSATYDQPTLTTGNGATTTVSCPCALGDFVYWAYTTDDRLASKSAYVSGANTVAVRFQNQSGTTSNAGEGTLNVFVVREEAFDFMGATMADPASLADGAGEDILVPVPGARKGDHALAAFSLDLQGISHSVEICADDTARVRLQNETGGTVDLGAMQVRVGAFIALG